MRRSLILLAATTLLATGCAKKATPPAAAPTTSASPSASPTTAAPATLGAVFYQDTFADKSKGWPLASEAGATFVLHDDYAVKQYTISVKGPGTSVSPHPKFAGITQAQLASYQVAATLQTTLSVSHDDLFGVTCRDLHGKRYTFQIGYDTAREGTMPWLIAKHDSTGVHVLARGTVPSGGSAFRVAGTCTGTDTAHLAMTVNDTEVGTADDTDAPLTEGYAGVYLWTKSGGSTINILDFAVRSAT